MTRCGSQFPSARRVAAYSSAWTAHGGEALLPARVDGVCADKARRGAGVALRRGERRCVSDGPWLSSVLLECDRGLSLLLAVLLNPVLATITGSRLSVWCSREVAGRRREWAKEMEEKESENKELWRYHFRKASDVPRRWPPPNPKLLLKDFKILLHRRDMALARLCSSSAEANIDVPNRANTISIHGDNKVNKIDGDNHANNHCSKPDLLPEGNL
ncbi:haloacid dehalogenase-like hydrolase superfamily protein [Striga asiatica]|uniref:Haloacid dehalogenase-like hydrolase superfamily protein n=1 Tax=Striga asiatica TaxID=4170 RepID=A0A5A7NWZ1_STRAF|nr:haloacid dehalogenase-like hydrolase superfamily protein [Striga asiatica]